MRRVVTLSVLGLSAGLLAGCDLKEVYPTAAQPLAGVRFINAVPDTAGAYGMDLRFVDQLESNAHFRQHFRNLPVTSGGVVGAVGVQFKHARAGQRQFRIFLDDTLPSLATVVIKDTTVTLEAGKNYTAILWGYANPTGPNRPAGAPAMRLTFVEETVVDPGASVALRVINATAYPLNVEHFAAAGAPTGTPSWANVAPLTASTHLTQATGQRRFAASPTAGTATVFYSTPAASPLALIGVAASSTAGAGAKLDIEALPGTTIAGSAVTMIVFPQSLRGIPRVAQHTTAIATNRRLGTITDLGGGVFRISDCFVTGGCLPAAPAPTNPAMLASGCIPDVFGDCTLTLTPNTGNPNPAITVVASDNGTGTVDTTTDLTAYLGTYTALGTNFLYTVIGYHSAGVTIWDRRPAYVP